MPLSANTVTPIPTDNFYLSLHKIQVLGTLYYICYTADFILVTPLNAVMPPELVAWLTSKTPGRSAVLTAGTKQLWSTVHSLQARHCRQNDPTVTAEELNDFFSVEVYLQPTYIYSHACNKKERPRQYQMLKASVSPTSSIIMYTSWIVLSLRLDNIPAWFLWVLAPVISRWIARLFNSSVNSSTIVAGSSYPHCGKEQTAERTWWLQADLVGDQGIF